MLDVVRLNVFVQVARTGSIAGAAKELTYTASAVSQQLSKLEREVGAVLATRTYMGIQLTAEGRVLLAHANTVLDNLKEAEQAVRDLAKIRNTEVRLGSFASGALTLLVPAIATFKAAYPAVRLSLVEIEPPGGYDDVRTGEIDLLLSHVYPGVTPPDTEGVVVEEVFADPLVAVLPESWTDGNDDEPLPAERLAGLPLISGSLGHANRTALERTLSISERPPQVEFEIRDYAVAMALVVAGAGATVMPWSLVASSVPSGVRVRLLENAGARRILTVRRTTAAETTVMPFLEELGRAANNLRARGIGLGEQRR
ncbi:LysR family transcriptional regulator [Actinoallomurus bryophytorum]|uniref:DNA-binding transcriptional LysR family regulator n=1 Tax=Actinoallomurus bryophytorum TaxID=1490222 RepID=A0A543CJF0_9ACTN|nr:LysR substrate-binding domain-containing protein [Actinoallomurus bryophytorum]TQL97017.1 DNA-binding transcriptional LysR family regulator [Actinoallomurus bryophytorum]